VSPSSVTTNQTKSSLPPQPHQQQPRLQQQPANSTRGSSNNIANSPLANIPVIGKLFGAK
jgi:hypothetical protein